MAIGTSTVSVGKGRLPAAPRRRDHRAALSALALLLVVLGALGSALIVYRSGHRTDVLVAAHDIAPGQQVDSGDFSTARVAADSGDLVKQSDERNVVGDVARVGIPAGTLVNPDMFQGASIIPADGVVIGITVSATQRPASAVSAGDVVRAFNVTKTTSGDPTQSGVAIVAAARVVSVAGDSTSSDTITVSLLVTSDDAQRLIGPAGQGTVSIAELPKSVKPSIDFRSTS